MNFSMPSTHHVTQWLRALVVASLVMSVSVAAAGVPRVRLSYEKQAGAQQCPEVAAFETAVAARLGYRPFDATGADTIRVIIGSGKVGLSAIVEKLDASGTPRGRRELTSPRSDCGDLSMALAFAVSVAIDPVSSMRPALLPDVDAGTAEPVDAGVPQPEVSVVPVPVSSGADAGVHAEKGPGFGVGLGPLGSLGSAPNVAAGLMLRARVQWPRFSLAVEGRVDLPSAIAITGGTASISQYTGALVPCAHFGWAAGCVVVAAGALRSEATGFAGAKQQQTPMVAVGVRGQAALRLIDLLSLEPFLELLVPLTRTVVTSAGETVWATPAVAGSLGLALMFHFQ